MAELIGVKKGISGSQRVSEGSHSETLIFRADSESLFDQYAEVLQHEKYPRPNVTFHEFFTEFVCRSVEPEHDERSLNIWYVKAEYSVGGETSLSNSQSPQPQWGDPPERWYPTLNFGSEIRWVNADAAKSNLIPAHFLSGISRSDCLHILEGSKSEVFFLEVDFRYGADFGGHFTAAGEVYVNPGVQVPEHVNIIEITRYEKEFAILEAVYGDGFFSPPTLYRRKEVSWAEYKWHYVGSVNKHTWYRHPPRTVMIDDMQASTVWHGSTPYNRVTYRLRADLNFPGNDSYSSEDDQSFNGGLAMTSSHDPIVLHGGFKQIADGEIKRILDADGSPLPTQTPVAPMDNWPCLQTLGESDPPGNLILSLGQAYPADAWPYAVTNKKRFVFPYFAYRERKERDFSYLNFDLEKFFPTMFKV